MAHLDAAGRNESDPHRLAVVLGLLERGPQDRRGEHRDHRGEATVVTRHEERVGRPRGRVLNRGHHALLDKELALGDAPLKPPVPKVVIAL